MIQVVEPSATADSEAAPQGVGEADEAEDQAEQAVEAEVVVADASSDSEQQAEEVCIIVSLTHSHVTLGCRSF